MRAIFLILLVSAGAGCVMDEPYIYDQPHCGGHAYYSTPIAGPSGVVPASYTQTQEPELLPKKR